MPPTKSKISKRKASKKTAPLMAQDHGAIVDKAFEIVQKIADFKRDIKALEIEQKDLESALRLILDRDHVTVLGGEAAQYERTKKDLCIITDYPKFTEFVRVNNRFDLMQKRLSAEVAKLHKDGTTPPGVGTMMTQSHKFKARK